MSDIEMEVIGGLDSEKVIEDYAKDWVKDNEDLGYSDGPTRKRASVRRRIVFELKKGALTHEEIANEIFKIYRYHEELDVDDLPKNYNKFQVGKDISRWLDQYQEKLMESGREMVMVEVQRIDEMMKALWDRVRRVDGPAELKAMDRILKLQDRKAKFLGLDEPEKLELADRSEDEGFRFGWADPSKAPKHKNGEKDKSEESQKDSDS